MGIVHTRMPIVRFYPKGVLAHSPGLRLHRYPGLKRTPNYSILPISAGLWQIHHTVEYNVDLNCGIGHLQSRNPFGVDNIGLAVIPRVVLCGQPWAKIRNPFGVGSEC